MDVKIGSRWESLFAEAIASGRYASKEDVVSEGLRLVAERERAFAELKVSLVAALEEGGSFTSEEVAAYVEARIAKHHAGQAAE